MKRYIFLIHRWLGISLCLFMAMWFFSGVVMMYVGYPKLTTSERLERLPSIDTAKCCISLDEAILASGIGDSPRKVRLTSVSSMPRYVMTLDKQRVVAIDAQNGKRIDAVSVSDAIEAASVFSKGAKVTYLDMVQEDAWTHSKALDLHRPLHRIQIQDEEATFLYVSSLTGEVVRDATKTERVWNWVGAWIHWLYPFRGGALDKYHRDIIVYSSLAATLLAVIGMVVGVMRWKLKGCYGNESKSPYRSSFMRWHHYFGLGFGVVTVAWILSGLLSMNPWKVFDSGGKPLDELAFSGGAIIAGSFPTDLGGILKKLHLEGDSPRELEWRMLNGNGYYIAFWGGGHTKIIPASKDEQPLAMFPFELLEATGARLVPGALVEHREILREYDFYYYARAPHTMSGHVEKRLPVLRLKFDDLNSTWVHIDPYTGAVIGELDAHQRVRRWLFALLHSWDWLPLLERRPFWDVLLILLSIGGFLVSYTGVVIGWQRLKRKQGKSGRKSSSVSDANNTQAAVP